MQIKKNIHFMKSTIVMLTVQWCRLLLLFSSYLSEHMICELMPLVYSKSDRAEIVVFHIYCAPKMCMVECSKLSRKTRDLLTHTSATSTPIQMNMQATAVCVRMGIWMWMCVTIFYCVSECLAHSFTCHWLCTSMCVYNNIDSLVCWRFTCVCGAQWYV